MTSKGAGNGNGKNNGNDKGNGNSKNNGNGNGSDARVSWWIRGQLESKSTNNAENQGSAAE